MISVPLMYQHKCSQILNTKWSVASLGNVYQDTTSPDCPCPSPWGSPHPAHGPVPYVSPLGPPAPGQWCCNRDSLQLLTSLSCPVMGSAQPGPPMGPHPGLASAHPHPQGGAQCSGAGAAPVPPSTLLLAGAGTGPGCQGHSETQWNLKIYVFAAPVGQGGGFQVSQQLIEILLL